MSADVDEDLLASWHFDLPTDRIATVPLPRRSASRLLHLDVDGGLHHRHFEELVSLLRPEDVLVVNDTTVIPARLRGEKVGSGGRVEILLVRRDEVRPDEWIVLLQASKKPKPESRLCFYAEVIPAIDDGDSGLPPRDTLTGATLLATMVGPEADEPGTFRLRFDDDALDFARRHGEIPLPPYMGRRPDGDDSARYQTVFRDHAKEGSVAAPTAGLHFDDAMLAKVREMGVTIAPVTLHVGPGTFLPVRADRLSEHEMHPEAWWLPASTAAACNTARARGGRVVAVGTTSARVLESAHLGQSRETPFAEGRGLTRLFIKPPHRVSGFDALITNFHLPESTLLVLVGTLMGRRRILDAYAAAVDNGYRFYSYGDASFLEW